MSSDAYTRPFPSCRWSYGVTVSTPDSESGDRGSNPRKTFSIHVKPRIAAVASRRRTVRRDICGSQTALPIGVARGRQSLVEPCIQSIPAWVAVANMLEDSESWR